jgi:putative ABC transport system permease protein
MFRREWRQQLLVLLLLTVTVGGAIFGAAAARSLTPDLDGQFGSADHQLSLSATDPDQLATTYRELRARFGAIDVIGSRQVAIPGSVDSVEFRSQDPDGPFGRPMLGLRSGRYPVADEVAVTPGLAADLGLHVGSDLHLDRVDRRVVGIVENPAETDEQFALVAPGDPRAQSHTVLVKAPDEAMRSLPRGIDGVGVRGDGDANLAAVGALGLAVVVAILVCLVAAAAFVVLAQRRLRQLGMLASLGATTRQLRLVVLANGVVVGAVAAVSGAALAAITWMGLSPLLERAAGRRLDRFDVPWWIVAAGMGLALATSTAAAWWPGRAVARVPVHLALSSRPPGPRPVRRSAVAAAVLVGAGFAALAFGLDPTKEEARVGFVLPGIAALVAGVLLLSPLAVSVLGPISRRLPIAGRLALRDLARHQARSGTALAAITLSLGLAVSTVLIAGAAEHTPDEGNLPANQVLVRVGDREPIVPELSADGLEARAAAARALARSLHTSAIPLDAAVTMAVGEQRDGIVYHPSVVLGRPVGDVTRDISDLYVATPALADHLGLDLTAVNERVDVLTPHTGTLRLANTKTGRGKPIVEAIDTPAYSAAPTSLLTPAAMARYGWSAVPVGWLIETSGPLTASEIDAARSAAADANLTVETRDRQEGLTSVRTVATAVGMGLALAILAMSVGLIRGEAANEVRTLAATGAPAHTRRTIVAATAGALALLGVLIGTVAAYLALIAGYLEDLHPLTRVPVVDLLVTVLGVPLLAFAVGWLLAGREPPLSRPAID